MRLSRERQLNPLFNIYQSSLARRELFAQITVCFNTRLSSINRYAISALVFLRQLLVSEERGIFFQILVTYHLPLITFMESIFIEDSQIDEKLFKIAAETDKFEGYGHAHAARMAVIADALAQKFKLGTHDRFSLSQAALVHDCGEMAMNREYIGAKRLLRVDERVDMQRHPVIGEQESAKQGLSRAVQLLVRWHHEWWNGTGYPDALEQENIPLAARILRVADTYAALTDDRPFRAALTRGDARMYLIEWAGIEFDPRIVKQFLALENFKELESFAGASGNNASAAEDESRNIDANKPPQEAFEIFNDSAG
jgi:HD-GYP domain-containing protein (c-di-GMP phosphodiesterase class II)